MLSTMAGYCVSLAQGRIFGEGYTVHTVIGLVAVELYIQRQGIERNTPKIFAALLTTVPTRSGRILFHSLKDVRMARYEFTLILSGSLELTEDIADALFEAGCDDGTPGTCNGVFSIDFHRDADSLEEAIHSAIGHVNSAGYEVERVEIEADAVPAQVNL